MSDETQLETELEPIKIDLVNEMLTAIGIVHGSKAEQLWRRIASMISQRDREVAAITRDQEKIAARFDAESKDHYDEREELRARIRELEKQLRDAERLRVQVRHQGEVIASLERLDPEREAISDLMSQAATDETTIASLRRELQASQKALRDAERACVNAFRGGVASMEPAARELAALRDGIERLLNEQTRWVQSSPGSTPLDGKVSHEVDVPVLPTRLIRDMLDRLKPRSTLRVTVAPEHPECCNDDARDHRCDRSPTFDSAIGASLAAQTQKLVDSLTPREREILETRFGHTDRVKELEKRVLERLRRPASPLSDHLVAARGKEPTVSGDAEAILGAPLAARLKESLSKLGAGREPPVGWQERAAATEIPIEQWTVEERYRRVDLAIERGEVPDPACIVCHRLASTTCEGCGWFVCQYHAQATSEILHPGMGGDRHAALAAWKPNEATLQLRRVAQRCLALGAADGVANHESMRHRLDARMWLAGYVKDLDFAGAGRIDR